MIFLAKLSINLKEREGRRDINDCHQLHRTVMSAFGDSVFGISARQEKSVLFRTYPGNGTEVGLYVQSNVPPDVSCWVGRRHLAVERRGEAEYIQISDPAGIFPEGIILHFDLLACPAKKIGGSTREKRLNGQKINSRRVILANPEARLDWLQKKAPRGGFQLLTVYEDGSRTITGKKPDGTSILHVGVRFRGLLQVQDSVRFAKCMETGIGAGKAHGLGLLMVSKYKA